MNVWRWLHRYLTAEGRALAHGLFSGPLQLGLAREPFARLDPGDEAITHKIPPTKEEAFAAVEILKAFLHKTDPSLTSSDADTARDTMNAYVLHECRRESKAWRDRDVK
jgi:hypothetical protein